MSQAPQRARTKTARPGELAGTGYSPHLTTRQFQVLRAVARGRTNKQIADSLGISHTTAKWHVTTLMTKFDVTNRTELSYAAVKRGLA